MNAIETDGVGFLFAIREFLGWCLIVNFGILILSSVAIIVARGSISGLHGRMFGLDEASLPDQYFRYLANFKIAVIVFNFTPYVVLHILL